MPFLETCRMEERIRMLSDYETGNWNVSSCAAATACVATRSTIGASAETARSALVYRSIACAAPLSASD